MCFQAGVQRCSGQPRHGWEVFSSLSPGQQQNLHWWHHQAAGRHQEVSHQHAAAVSASVKLLKMPIYAFLILYFKWYSAGESAVCRSSTLVLYLHFVNLEMSPIQTWSYLPRNLNLFFLIRPEKSKLQTIPGQLNVTIECVPPDFSSMLSFLHTPLLLLFVFLSVTLKSSAYLKTH